MRNIIIGDVHGCCDTLNRLIRLVAPASGDRLIFLGDLFDRGPDSYGVLETVMELEQRFGEDFILLRGNHEDYLLARRLTLQQRWVWDMVGRGATVRSFKSHGAKMEDARPWLEAHARLYYRGEGFQGGHAGLLGHPPEDNDRETLLHDHDVVRQNAYRGPLTVVGHIALPVPTYFPGDGETTAQLEYGVTAQLPDTGVICVDTGCGKGGQLTAMIIEGRRYRLECVL